MNVWKNRQVRVALLLSFIDDVLSTKIISV